jgi:stage V sporulation protein S
VDNLKVSATTEPKKLAGAIVAQLRDHQKAIVDCVGPEAINQAIKACAVARGYVAPNGKDLSIKPAFFDAISNTPDTPSIGGLRLTVKIDE